LVGLIVAVAAGFLWAFMVRATTFLLFSLLISAAIGYAIGEVISRVTNRKRGVGLQVIGCISVVVCFVVFYLVVQYIFISLFSMFMIIGLAIAIAIVIARLRNQYLFLSLFTVFMIIALAIVIAITVVIARLG
jgi:hypothetical protein